MPPECLFAWSVASSGEYINICYSVISHLLPNWEAIIQYLIFNLPKRPWHHLDWKITEMVRWDHVTSGVLFTGGETERVISWGFCSEPGLVGARPWDGRGGCRHWPPGGVSPTFIQNLLWTFGSSFPVLFWGCSGNLEVLESFKMRNEHISLI